VAKGPSGPAEPGRTDPEAPKEGEAKIVSLDQFRKK
jgi:hypothetical protein